MRTASRLRANLYCNDHGRSIHPDGAAVVFLSGIECKIVHPASCIVHQKSSSLINQDFVGVDGGAYPWQEGIVGHYVDGAVEELFQ